MFNSFNYNEKDFNELGRAITLADQSNIVFNGYSLQNTNIISSILVQDSTPERAFGTVAVPRGDGEIILGDYWRKKTIKVSGIIKEDTNALLEAELDNMKKALAVPEGTFDIKINGEIRRYHATLINGHSLFDQRKGYHITFCPFEAEFVTVEPYGHDVLYTGRTYENQTLLSFPEQYENLGTVRGKPVVIFNVSAATSITAISFLNNTTGEEIKLTASISAGDYIRFDSETLEVTKNGVVQDYSGTFPRFDTGVNSFTVTITGTSITYTLTVKAKTPYL